MQQMTSTESSTQPTGHLERLRLLEFSNLAPLLKPGMRVLEIGGGSGYQASLIAQRGCRVTSIDLVDVRPHRVYFQVQPYDGRTFPCETGSVDLVFSSNVLEHVRDLPTIFQEMRRVLAPGGHTVHLMPSSTWRFCTTAAYVVYVAMSLAGLQKDSPGTGGRAVSRGLLAEKAKRLGRFEVLRRAIREPFRPHGEFRNAFSELYYYRAARWKRVFEANGFEVCQTFGSGVFYTGYSLLPRLSMRARKIAARVLGSACNVILAQPR